MNNAKPKFIVGKHIFRMRDIVVLEKLADGSIKLFIKHVGNEKITVEQGADKIWHYYKEQCKSIKSDTDFSDVEFIKVGNKIIQLRNVAAFCFRDPSVFEIITKLGAGLSESLPIEINLIEPEYREKFKEFVRDNTLNSEFGACEE